MDDDSLLVRTYNLTAGTAWNVLVTGQVDKATRMGDIRRVLGYPLSPQHVGYEPHVVRVEPLATTGRDVGWTRPRGAPDLRCTGPTRPRADGSPLRQSSIPRAPVCDDAYASQDLWTCCGSLSGDTVEVFGWIPT